jgi:hypothetical protein
MASMAKDYTKISAIQQFDSTACWAASLEWWARAIGNRPIIAQLDLIELYRKHWDARNPNTNPNYGKISDEGLVEVLRDQRWGMNGANMPGSWFSCYDANQRMRFGPALLGYYEPSLSSYHVIAIYGASATHVACMDPHGARFTARPIGYFTRSNRLIVGWPAR